MTRLRVVMVSKALVVGAYQRKAEEIAARGVDLTVLTPPLWRDRRGSQALEHAYTRGYALKSIPVRWNGNFHLHFYPTLARELRELRPHVLHMDEEPYNLATWLALWSAARQAIPALFFSWQNLLRRYPPPFSWMERMNYGWAKAAIAGSREAAQVLQRKGFEKPIVVLPQFGVDPAVFVPGAAPPATGAPPAPPLRIGYAGGLLAEKGVALLPAACARLRGAWRLDIAGEGSMGPELARRAAELGITAQVRFRGRVPSRAMPEFLRELDVLVLPSKTTPRWKEQFGRVLVEAMATEVAVVGSSSGEIPHVIGEAGLIFPEGDPDALAARLQMLLDEPDQRRALQQAGRRRVLAHFTMERIAAETVALYHILHQEAG